MNESNNTHLFFDKDAPTPAQDTLYKMLLELTQKYIVLEKKMDDLLKSIPSEIKHMNIITWLNENHKPTLDLNSLIDSFSITDSMITMLFHKMNFYNLLDKLLINSNGFHYPIVVFENHPQKFYIYTDDDEDENEKKKWLLSSKEALVTFLNKIHMKICSYFFEWKKKNNSDCSESFDTACDKITIHLMDIDFKSNEHAFSKAKSILFKNMKQSINLNAKYDIVF
jgi:hypothetical protein